MIGHSGANRRLIYINQLRGFFLLRQRASSKFIEGVRCLFILPKLS